MKQITKTENVNYFAPDAQAIMTMANLMDMLIVNMNMKKTLEAAAKQGSEVFDLTIPQFEADMRKISSIDEKQIYDMLVNMGFVPTGKVDLFPEGYEHRPVEIDGRWKEEHPTTETQMQAEITKASMAEHVKTLEPANEEHADYLVELRAVNVPTENIKSLARRLAKRFPKVKRDRTYNEIKRGLCNSSKNNPYIMKGLFFDTAFDITKTVVDFNTVNTIPVFIRVKDKNGNEITQSWSS